MPFQYTGKGTKSQHFFAKNQKFTKIRPLQDELAAAQQIRVIVGLIAQGKVVCQGAAGVGAVENSVFVLLIRDLQHKMLGQGGAGAGEILLQCLPGGLADAVAGHLGMQAADHGAEAVLHGHGFQPGMQPAAVLGEHFVTRQQHGGHAHPGAGPAVQQEFRTHQAVEPHGGGQRGLGVGQGIAAAAGGGVVADEHGGIEAFVAAIGHGQGVARPVADELHAFRQAGGVNVDALAVGVLDHDLGSAGGDGAFAGGPDLVGHLAAVLPGPDVGKGAGLLPVGREGGALDVGADEYLHGRASPLQHELDRPKHIHKVAGLHDDGAVLRETEAGEEGAADGVPVLLEADLKYEFAGQADAGGGQVLLQGGLRLLPDLPAGQGGVQTLDGAAEAVLDGHGVQLGMQAAAVLCEHFVAGQQHGGHAPQGAGPAVEQELGAHHAVEAHGGGLGGKGMGQGVAAAAGSGVVADEHGGVKAVIHAVHHAHGAAAPAADDLYALGQLADVQIDGMVVGVVHQDVVGAGGDGALAGGLDLGGHLLGGGGIQVVAQLGLIPQGGESGALDIGTDKYAHNSILLMIRQRMRNFQLHHSTAGRGKQPPGKLAE